MLLLPTFYTVTVEYIISGLVASGLHNTSGEAKNCVMSSKHFSHTESHWK